MSSKRVCIITGGLLNASENSVVLALRKQWAQYKKAKNQWLETKIKLVSAEPIFLSKMTAKNAEVSNYFSSHTSQNIPELTEVILADELSKLSVDFDILTYHDLFENPKLTEKILQRANVIFASSTLLHDLSELIPLMEMIKRPHHKIILGGALTGSLYKFWEGCKSIDIMAIGYGEFLIPHLVEWMKSDYSHLTSPKYGKIIRKEHTLFLFSGSPETKHLDFLAAPNWEIAKNYHQKEFKHIYYESVRGCPYRCNFCNYPFLFDDTIFRYKSSQKIFDDWKYYADKLGVVSITCLDSLFTMPRKRLEELCNLLVQHQINIKWSCYARADDLTNETIVSMMKEAGANHLQIGIESGNQFLLDSMQKKCSVENNLKAILNCRKYQVTSLVSLIVGFPGETEKTIEETFEFMKSAKPDFHFLATFSVRVQDVPILSPENRMKFKLHTMHNPYSFAPYWSHYSMSCADVGNYVRLLNQKLYENKISLDGTLFYGNIDGYKQHHRISLLDYQYKLCKQKPLVRSGFDWVNHWVDRRLKMDVNNWLKSIH